MNAKQKRHWKKVCEEILIHVPPDHAGKFVKLLLDWRDAERAELLEFARDAITEPGAVAERSHEYAMRRLAAITEAARAAIEKAGQR